MITDLDSGRAPGDRPAVVAAAETFMEMRLGTLLCDGHLAPGSVVTGDYTAPSSLGPHEKQYWLEAVELVTRIWSAKATGAELGDYLRCMSALCSGEIDDVHIVLQVMATGVATWIDDVVGLQGDAYFELGEFRSEHPDPRRMVE